ncbi:unnamed protein product [Vicia faba]|uniref:Uncharacterized protein n=1 Tax=Vicia faba TaxID=3906 RepID=A0AAV1AYX0_VICFA|nr:unnamed protein product [Vicia faba]
MEEDEYWILNFQWLFLLIVDLTSIAKLIAPLSTFSLVFLLSPFQLNPVIILPANLRVAEVAVIWMEEVLRSRGLVVEDGDEGI